jgi:DNA-binding CsgD family transcriptional regulator
MSDEAPVIGAAGPSRRDAFDLLLGRGNECAIIDDALKAARSGHGAALVLHGEPGVGKSSLLEYAATTATADEFRILRASGNEVEKELPFAASQQLCASCADLIPSLPWPQRRALQVALGHREGVPPDRLFVGLALHGLLSLAASDRPVLCLIDDAQWIDQESARAFAVLAHRLASERIAVVFSARTVPYELSRLGALPIAGLNQDDGRTLLRMVLPDPFDEDVFERILAESRGNPLALLELPRGLTFLELAGGFRIPTSSPIKARIVASFRRRIAKLSPACQTLLLVAAAEPTGDPALVWRAAQGLGVDESVGSDDGTDGLLRMFPRVMFRHPLVRSAAYERASPAERRSAHSALASAIDADWDPDRRAWHLAQATWHPNDEVAMDLETSAHRAQARGGVVATAAFFERAAELTVDPHRRVGRMLAAAEAHRQSGALEAALELVAKTERVPMDDHQRACLEVLRARIVFNSERGRDAPGLLLAAAEHLQIHDARGSQEVYLDAMTAALFAGHLAEAGHAREVARSALSAQVTADPPSASSLLLEALALLVAEGPCAGTFAAMRALKVFRSDGIGTEDRLRWSWLAGRAAAYVWDYETWDALTQQQIVAARTVGALGLLPLTLSTSAGVQLFAGRLNEAAALIEEADAVADATDTRTAPYAKVLVAAYRGREADAAALIGSAARDFASRGEGMGVNLTRCAKAVLYNGLARYEEAYDAALSALEDPYELWFWPWVSVELIEAASRTGRGELAVSTFDRLVESTGAGGTTWAAAVEDRCHALLSHGSLAEKLYRSAIDQLAPTVLQLDLARTRLVFGEWLRRENRPADAREELRAAYGLFRACGSEGFAERARVELRATGERTGGVPDETKMRLTPQEARVAQLVAQGCTNLEIAAQMFISKSTVEYHLHKTFVKLGIKTRTQLARRILDASQELEFG